MRWRLRLRRQPRRLLGHPHHDLCRKTHGALGRRSNEEGMAHIHLRARGMVWMSLCRFPCGDALSQACNLSQRGPVCDWSHHPMSRRCRRSFLQPGSPLHHRFGGWCNVCQRTQLQCGSRTSRGPRQLGRSSAIIHYSWDHGLVLDQLRCQQY